MKTEKRNARTTKIFNNVMDAITKVYGINEHMTLKDIYEVMFEKCGLKFHFLDTNGKIIYNTFGIDKKLFNIGRRLTFIDSDEYIEASINNSEDYKECLIDTNQFDYDECDNTSLDDCVNFDNFLFLLTSSIIDSRLLTELVDSYICKYYKNKDYKALICFKTIFGYQFLSRKEFDRIRYIYFSNDAFYDVMGGHFCFHEFISATTKNSVVANRFLSFDYKTHFLSVVLFPLIKNAIVTKEEIKIIKENMPTNPFIYRSVPTNDSGKISSRYGGKSVISKVLNDRDIKRS